MSRLKRRSPLLLIIIAYLAFVSLGLPDGLLGVAWPSMHITFGVPLSSLGVLLIALSCGFLFSSFMSGQIIARFGIGNLLLMSSMLVTISLFGFATVPTWWMLAGCGVLLGAGGGAIDSGLNAYAASHFSTRHMNWLHAFYGLGATLGPLLITMVMSSGQPWQWGYALVGTVLSGMAVCFILTRHLWQSNGTAEAAASQPEQAGEAEQTEQTVQSGGFRSTLKQPLVWFGIALFFVYTGLEVTAGQWSYSLFTAGRGIAPDIAGVWVGIYWGSLTVGRLVFGVITDRLGARTVLRATMAAVLVGALLLWLNITPLLSFLGLALIGFMLAPVFPLLMAQTPARLGAAAASYAIGFQVAAANLGSALLPSGAGVLTRWMGLEVIGPFLLATAVLLLLLHELLLLVEKPEQQTVQAAQKPASQV